MTWGHDAIAFKKGGGVKEWEGFRSREKWQEGGKQNRKKKQK